MSLQVNHVSRLSDDVDLLVFARRINSQFLRSGLTELKKLDCEYEAAYAGPSCAPHAIVVFGRIEGDDHIEYYLPIVWTSPKHRGQGCYEQLLDWVKNYAKGKGARRISTDVHHDNKRMIRLKETHWEKTFVRFNLPL
jgi:GNAT superfamily N-acetyltransferase